MATPFKECIAFSIGIVSRRNSRIDWEYVAHVETARWREGPKSRAYF